MPTTLAAHLPRTIHVAEADVVGPLAVFPLIAMDGSSLDYLAFADACGRGAEIRELPDGASVNDLLVHNPVDVPVLLYEGEHVLGAQQNRTFDVSVLVPALTTLRVPVTCVEEGRWDYRRHADPFTSAPQAAYPELRRLKNEQVRAAMAAGEEPRAQQVEVWREVRAKSRRHGVVSDTGALDDVFEQRRDLLDRAGREVTMKCSQVGMIAVVGGRMAVLDYVSDVEAFAALHDALVAGYALDALEAPAIDRVAPSTDDARDFLHMLLEAPAQTTAAVGLGEGRTFEFGGLAGTGLVVEDELVALTAFDRR